MIMECFHICIVAMEIVFGADKWHYGWRAPRFLRATFSAWLRDAATAEVTGQVQGYSGTIWCEGQGGPCAMFAGVAESRACMLKLRGWWGSQLGSRRAWTQGAKGQWWESLNSSRCPEFHQQ